MTSAEHESQVKGCSHVTALYHSCGKRPAVTHVEYIVSPVTCFHASLNDKSQLVHNGLLSCLVYESVKPCMQPQQPSTLQDKTQLTRNGNAVMQQHCTTAVARGTAVTHVKYIVSPVTCFHAAFGDNPKVMSKDSPLRILVTLQQMSTR